MTHTPNDPVEIEVDQGFYDNFQEAILLTEGISFDELAVERPADAYKLFTHVIEEAAATGEIITTADGRSVSRKMDGEAATSAFARYAVREIAEDTDLQPIDVIVSVFQTPRFRDLVRGRKTEPKQVLSFRVEPPDLAN